MVHKLRNLERLQIRDQLLSVLEQDHQLRVLVPLFLVREEAAAPTLPALIVVHRTIRVIHVILPDSVDIQEGLAVDLGSQKSTKAKSTSL